MVAYPPPPTPESHALLMLTRALLRSASRRRRERYLMALAAILTEAGAVSPLNMSRPREERLADARAHAEAVAWLRHVLPVLVGEMGAPDDT
jgi:hypothetical protein